MNFVVKAGLIVLALVHTEIIITMAEVGYDRMHLFYYGKSGFAAEAVYQIPGTYEEIVVERRAAHLFLAEYDRELIFRIGDREFVRRDVAMDSGGYSKMKLYRLSPTIYFLCGELDYDTYVLDAAGRSIRDVHFDEKFSNATYLGVFDNDEEHGWSFITAHQRAEEYDKVAGSGCSLIYKDFTV